jgi:outer membrane protein TolC
LACAACLAWAAVAPAQPPDELPPPRPALEAPVLGIGDVVNWALQHNPELATARQNHGIAAAAVVIARTYPFNPIAQHYVWGDNGPTAALVTNHVFNEHTFRLDLELRGQGGHRRAMAQAALSRTDNEIATLEVAMAVRAIRAFNAFLYRRDKLRVLEESLQLQERTAEQIGRLVEQNRLPRVELLLARADLSEARALRGPAQTNLDIAANDLRRVLGVVDEPFQVLGTLEATVVRPDVKTLMEVALEHRPDLRGFKMGLQEAEARLRLEIANRWGNPSLGPAMEYNETSVTFVGMWMIWQIPVLNTRQGDIMMRRAERGRARLLVEQSEVQIRQDVQAALARLTDAEEVVRVYRTETLPAVRESRETLDRWFAQGEAGVDLARVIEIRRRLLRLRDAYLDALWEMNQSKADLAAALGDPSVAIAAPPEAAK